MPHRKFKVHGKVQGVWFRKNTQEKARELNLTGTVQNLDDGSVQAYASGSAKALDAFGAWLWKGSPQSEVSDVKVTDLADADYDGFEILR